MVYSETICHLMVGDKGLGRFVTKSDKGRGSPEMGDFLVTPFLNGTILHYHSLLKLAKCFNQIKTLKKLLLGRKI